MDNQINLTIYCFSNCMEDMRFPVHLWNFRIWASQLVSKHLSTLQPLICLLCSVQAIRRCVNILPRFIRCQISHTCPRDKYVFLHEGSSFRNCIESKLVFILERDENGGVFLNQRSECAGRAVLLQRPPEATMGFIALKTISGAR